MDNIHLNTGNKTPGTTHCLEKTLESKNTVSPWEKAFCLETSQTGMGCAWPTLRRLCSGWLKLPWISFLPFYWASMVLMQSPKYIKRKYPHSHRLFTCCFLEIVTEVTAAAPLDWKTAFIPKLWDFFNLLLADK